MPVGHAALEHVKQLGAGMLEEGKHFARLGEGYEYGFHTLVLAAECAEELVEVARS
ncbi:hypothetical protein ACFPRL_19750 [Pseudoclavibacter helvolus]